MTKTIAARIVGKTIDEYGLTDTELQRGTDEWLGIVVTIVVCGCSVLAMVKIFGI